MIEWRERPRLVAPAAVLAFSGWNDAGEAATGALEELLRHGDDEPFAVLPSEEFVDFQQSRPTVDIDEGGTRYIAWPDTELYAVRPPGASRDLVVVVGDEPHLRWKTFTDHLIDGLLAVGVDRTVALGAFIGQVAHTVPVPVIAVGPADVVRRLGLMSSRYTGPTGIVGVFQDRAVRRGLEAVSLWAAVPHYLAGNPNPGASLALLTEAGRVLDVDLDLTRLHAEAELFMREVDEAVADSDELVEYIQELEDSGEVPTLDPEAGTRLVNEIERFLRDGDR